MQPSDQAPEAANVVGLADALRASLDAARKPRRGGRAATKKKAGLTSGSKGRAKNSRQRGAA